MKALAFFSALLLSVSAANAATYRIDISTADGALDNYSKAVSASGFIEITETDTDKFDVSSFDIATSGTYCRTSTSFGTECKGVDVSYSSAVRTFTPVYRSASSFTLRSGSMPKVFNPTYTNDFLLTFRASLADLFDDAADGYLFREVTVTECQNCDPSHSYKIRLSYGSLEPERPDFGAVPLPATGILMLAAMGGLAMARGARRRG